MTTFQSVDLLPKISVITVVRNGEQHIEDTIQSVLGQSYGNIEYIIIDGNSTDGTVSIIRKYEDKLAGWISEPDKGIYDAMNKGVARATGQWLLFINADDFLASPSAIEDSVAFIAGSDKKIAYGQVMFLFNSGKTKLYGQSWEASKPRFRKVANCIPHQATFHHHSLFKDEKFDISFKIAGDYDFLLRHLKNHDALFFPVIVTNMRADGVSFSSSKIKLLKDTRKAQLKNKVYRFFPPMSWLISATKLLAVDTIIRVLGESGKDRIKRLVQS